MAYDPAAMPAVWQQLIGELTPAPRCATAIAGRSPCSPPIRPRRREWPTSAFRRRSSPTGPGPTIADAIAGWRRSDHAVQAAARRPGQAERSGCEPRTSSATLPRTAGTGCCANEGEAWRLRGQRATRTGAQRLCPGYSFSGCAAGSMAGARLCADRGRPSRGRAPRSGPLPRTGAECARRRDGPPCASTLGWWPWQSVSAS